MRTSLSPVLAASLLLGACGGDPAAQTDNQNAANGADTPAGGGSTSNGTGGSNPGNGQSSGGPSDFDGGTAVCETLEAVARPQIPKVLIVLDRSGSMAGERWDKAILALDSLVAKFPSYLFGLSMYPAVGEELDCKSGKLDVATDVSTGPQIHDALFAPAARVTQDVGYTPTAKTLAAAYDYYGPPLDDPHPRYVLLVTDGQPNCNAAGPEKYTADLDATLLALDTLLGVNVPTFVFGYRVAELAPVMDQLATHGGTDHHYPVEDETTIVDAFAQISQQLAPCTYELDAEPAGLEFVRVLLDGKDLELGADGFSLTGTTTIELGEASCSTLRDGGVHGLKVLVECEPVRVL